MSLEDAILKLTAVVTKQNELTERLLAIDPAAAPAAADKSAKSTKATKADKPATDESSTEDKGDDAAPSYEVISKKALAWVSETGKGSPEQKARSAYLQENIWPKLEVESIKGLQGDADKLAKFASWLENKAGTDLCGYGNGIFAAPASDDNVPDDGDL